MTESGNGGKPQQQGRREFLRSTAWVAAIAGLGGRGLLAAPKEKDKPKSEPAAKPKEGGAGKKILILGGTRFLGPAVVEAARKRGHSITLFNRGKTNPGLFPDVETLLGDRNGNLKSLEGRAWDAVVDTSGYVPRIVRDSATLLGKTTPHYLFISTISVYAPGLKAGSDESAAVATIADPTTEKVDNDTYGALKALCEQAAEKAMPGKVANIRPGLIVGPDDPTDRFTYWPVRVARGGEVLAPGGPGDPVQFIDVRDLGEWIVKVIEDRTVGVFNAVGPAERTGIGRLLDACNVSVGEGKAKFTWADAAFLAEQKVEAWSDMPVWVPADGDDAGAAQVAIGRAIGKGLAFRPIGDTCRTTLDWFKTLPADRQAKLKSGVTPERETAVLAAWHARQQPKG
jgi:2'-hydroxyisoflavone reductase